MLHQFSDTGTYYSDMGGCAPGKHCCPSCANDGLGAFSDSVGTLGVMVGLALVAYFIFKKKQ